MTDTLAIDFAWQQISAGQMKAAGYLGGAIRYISHDASKDMTLQEISNDHAAGLPIACVYESTANRANQGDAAGKADAVFCNKRLDDLGFPRTATIYAAVDYDGQDECIPYFQGWHAITGMRPLSAYASGYLIRRLKQLGLIKFGWQTMSTGFRESTPVNRKYVDLLQRFPTRDIPGHPRSAFDENVIYVADWGAWIPPGHEGGDEDLTPELKAELKKIEASIAAERGRNDQIQAHVAARFDGIDAALARIEKALNSKP